MPTACVYNAWDELYVCLPHWYILTHWGRVAPICVDNLTIIGSDNGLSPGRHQAIIWSNVEILLLEPLGTNFSEISIEIIIFSVKKMPLKMSSGNWRPFWLGLNELTLQVPVPKIYGSWTLSSLWLLMLQHRTVLDKHVFLQVFLALMIPNDLSVAKSCRWKSPTRFVNIATNIS